MSKPFTVPNNTSGAPGFSANFFIGQVPLGQESNKVFADKWADRVQVRIVGADTPEGTLLHDNDLRTATVLKPTSQGNFNRGSTGIVGGEWVIGIFVSGPPEYDALILGVLGRSDGKYQITREQQKEIGSTYFKAVNPWQGAIKPIGVTAGDKVNIASTRPLVPDEDEFKSSYAKGNPLGEGNPLTDPRDQEQIRLDTILANES